MAGVRLSEKHGVNPTIPICFWCGEEKGEVVLLGKLPGDKEAPRRMIIGYEPCDKCKEKMAQGVTFMQSSDKPYNDGQPPMQDGAYPSGKWAVMGEEDVKKIFNDDTANDLIKKKKAFMDEQTWNSLGFGL